MSRQGPDTETNPQATRPVESLWQRYPDYRVNLHPLPLKARAWYGDQLLADSSDCLRVSETRHRDCLYFPEGDVYWELFEPSEHRTTCPFKGEAAYWSLTAADPVEENLVWAYPEPFPEVAGLAGYVGFYSDRVRIVLEEPWPQAPEGVLQRRFPLWGDQRDLLHLMNPQPGDTSDVFIAPAFWKEEPVDHHGQPFARNVVEGGQLLGQAIVAASKAAPAQRVTSGYMTFTRPAGFHLPLQTSVTALRRGRSFSTLQTQTQQAGKLCCVGLFLLDAGGAEAFRETVDMPPVAAAMRPQPGFSEAQAHKTVSTAPLSVSIAFHDEVDLREWLLYANRAIYAGRGQAQGEGHVFTRDGRLVASYTVHAMIRPFSDARLARSVDSSTAM